MIETELAAWLATNVPLVASRIYPSRLPQSVVLPAITYLKVSGPRVPTHQGPSGLAKPRFQISCWDEKYLDAKAVAVQVRQALNCYSGMMGALRVGVALLRGERDLVDPARNIHQIALDFEVAHEE